MSAKQAKPVKRGKSGKFVGRGSLAVEAERMDREELLAAREAIGVLRDEVKRMTEKFEAAWKEMERMEQLVQKEMDRAEAYKRAAAQAIDCAREALGA